jgi:hypothetical protein
MIPVHHAFPRRLRLHLSFSTVFCRLPRIYSGIHTARPLLIRLSTKTIFLCVWQAIHLNVPSPGEAHYKQLLRRIRWSILAIIALEMVALNAWLQHCQAHDLMKSVNLARGFDAQPPSQNSYQHIRHWTSVCLGWMNKAWTLVTEVFQQLIFADDFEREFRQEMDREERQANVIDLDTKVGDNAHPWTIDTAFYAISGATVLVDYGDDLAITTHGFKYLAEQDPRSLIPLQRAALQDPSKATGLTKLITCAQAMWFCTQCIARLSQNMAISLVELNTFAHCISAFFIYAFWWHKPYDVETHVYIRSPELLHEFLLKEATSGTRYHATGSNSQWSRECFEPLPDAADDLKISEKDSRGHIVPGGTVRLARYDPPLRPESEEYQHVQSDGPILRREPDHWPNKVKPGYPIPDTGFVVSYGDLHLKSEYPIPNTGSVVSYGDLDLTRSPELRLSNNALTCWKRLWQVRLDSKFDMQPTETQNTKRKTRSRIKNLDNVSFDAIFEHKMVAPVLAVATLLYGGIHLLAWQYNFQTNAEQVMWRIASATTASTGLVVIVSMYQLRVESGLLTVITVCLLLWVIVIEFFARSFLVIESFRALPNSPPSVYEMITWTTYIPHV